MGELAVPPGLDVRVRDDGMTRPAVGAYCARTGRWFFVPMVSLTEREARDIIIQQAREAYRDFVCSALFSCGPRARFPAC